MASNDPTLTGSSDVSNFDSLLPGPHPNEKLAEYGWKIASSYTPSLVDTQVPEPPNEWTGRDSLLESLSSFWEDDHTLIAGLIGFGGEGKTSIVCSWVYNCLLKQRSSLTPPKGIFYWDFYKSRSIDKFFEAAMTYLGAADNTEKIKSAHDRSSLLAGMFLAGKYLLILDGLEILQYQSGEDYGLLQNPDLKDFLTYFASGEHGSLCLITSRAPIIDLIEYITYSHINVSRLSDADGRDLLRYFLKKSDSDEQLDQVVARWDGHALTLSLIGAYVRQIHNQDLNELRINFMEDIAPPSSTEAYERYYQRVGRVLRRYDEHLSVEEKGFLESFCAFRLPVLQKALDEILKATPSMVNPLYHYRILRRNSSKTSYTVHPLIRQHYLSRLKTKPEENKAVNGSIAKYYLGDIAEKNIQDLTLQDLTPVIEAVHHLCEANHYDKARRVLLKHIDYKRNNVLTLQLGAYDTRLKILSEFFPDENLDDMPFGSPSTQYFVLKETGFCLIALGRLREAPFFFKRGSEVAKKTNNINNFIHAYRDLASSYVYLGKLADASRAIKAANRAIKVGNDADSGVDSEQVFKSLALESWIAHLHGEIERAEEIFAYLEAEQRKKEPSRIYLYGSPGVFQTEHLIRLGDWQKAKVVAEANLEVSKSKRWLERVSRCHRLIGNLLLDSQDYDDASFHYSKAIEIAREISHRPVLMEALRAQGTFLIYTRELDEARNELNEALKYAIKGGYRISEVNIRTSMAWLLLKEKEGTQSPEQEKDKRLQAKSEANVSLKMSNQMGYHWGRIDSEEILSSLQVD